MLIELTVHGETTEVEIDPDLAKFTLQETVRLEEALGDEVFDKLMGSAGEGGDYEIPSRPSILQALLWAKLASTYPSIGRYDFDLDLSELGDLLGADSGVVIPMSVEGQDIPPAVVSTASGNV